MNPLVLKTKCALALVMVGILTVGSAMADKGGRHEGKDRREEQGGDRRNDDRKSHDGNERRPTGDGHHFQEQHHVMVREYYSEHYRGHRCPPGLAKKNNGCVPPGQARKWQVGRPLPREVIYYQVPAPLVVQIGPPPAGHRYVRVAGDILLIAIGTGMVVDAIQDLGGM